ncbi:MAG: D-alanyl-D-alanine carboxypeptidase [Cyclobacteriaceae bacterium]|nr:D-alanyl-D-alanine carboxypeptidase [Cyclobacteriaceae bacterium]
MNKNLIWLALIFCSCTVQKIKNSVRDSEVFEKGHIGFMLVDPDKDKTLYALNEKKYFIPASNTKIFTLYTSYKALGTDRTNGINYLQSGDSLIFWGTGDPSLLHPDLKDRTVIEFLKASPYNLYMVDDFEQVNAYGPGWSWDWYNYYYGPDRSVLPVYGNVVRFQKDKTQTEFMVYPERFQSELTEAVDLARNNYNFRRAQFTNTYRYYVNKENTQLSFETDKPFITSPSLAATMVSEAIEKPITLIPNKNYRKQIHQKLKSAPIDSIYKQMMKISDNFLAEQLMLLVSDQLFDSINIKSAIEYSKTNWLSDLPDDPEWVDGSGLSSQNKFTPRTIISLLGKIKAELPMEKIKAYFPAGGESGTIKAYYKSDLGQPPYVYAKTGTLSMSTALSGYLFTKSGKVLLFSFLLNNYTIPSDELKKEMEKVLYFIHSKY